MTPGIKKKGIIINSKSETFWRRIENGDLSKADGGREKELRIIISLLLQSSINHLNMAAGAGRSDPR